MDHPKSLIVGASGQVGSQLVESLKHEEDGASVLRTSRQPKPGWLTLDLANLASLETLETLLDARKLRAIYCVGGMTYVDGCEAEPDLAFRTNAIGPGVLSAYAAHLGIPFVYYSTEYVFSGHADNPGPFNENASPEPLNVYGRSKLEGEQRILSANPKALVLRTTVVYGPDQQAKNFVYGVMRQLGAGQRMKVPMDQISTPTYNRDLVSATLGLVRARASGIFHVTGPELLGRLDFARSIAALLHLDATLLDGVPTSTLGQPAPRPLAAGLSIGKLNAMYPELRMRPLAEAVKDCIPDLRRFLDHGRC